MVLKEFFDLLRVYRGHAPSATCPGNAPDVAVIMGAQVLPGGRPSPALEARVRHGAALYRRGVVDLLIPTGGLGEHPPAEARLMLGILLDEGVPDKAVILEDEALNTRDSAVLIAKMVRARKFEGVRVATDPLHCVRTVWAFRRAGLSACAEPTYDSPVWRKPWSRRGHLVREFGALAWYKILYKAGSLFQR